MEKKSSLTSVGFIIFDVSDYKPEPEKPKPVYTEQLGTGSNEYEIWLEGFAATGQSGKAHQVNLTNETSTKWKGDTFQDACKNAMTSLHWEIDGWYDNERNTYWACRFFDNEQDARKSFG